MGTEHEQAQLCLAQLLCNVPVCICSSCHFDWTVTLHFVNNNWAISGTRHENGQEQPIEGTTGHQLTTCNNCILCMRDSMNKGQSSSPVVQSTVYRLPRWLYHSFPQPQHFSHDGFLLFIANQCFFNNCFPFLLINMVSTNTHSDLMLNLCAKFLLCQIFVVSNLLGVACTTEIWLKEVLTHKNMYTVYRSKGSLGLAYSAPTRSVTPHSGPQTH